MSTESSDRVVASFNALTLNPPQSSSDTKEAEAAKASLIAQIQLNPRDTPFSSIAAMPEAARTSSRYYFYGWPIHFAPFISLASKSGHRPQEFRDEYTMLDGLLYIRRESGYKWAHLTAGVIDNEADLGYALSGESPFSGEKTTYMITVFTNSWALADRIPTGPQMLRLAEIFEYRVPRWYKDARPRSDFSLYCMM
ncbi:hypothetical protein Hypma_014094 [Hypsizygus marmoreus]|uniref:Uncharacterized protein n=1 Tax=Hypsizygus marmoreus TaxID=39966 RepID=A0A369KG26_HYPMA|nr:hypothetical protein Hypma_014094 [Hypsizygus marmoreus]